MSYFYIYEWREEQWVGQPAWLSAFGACSVTQASPADWFAIYSSKPVQIVGGGILSKPQAYAAMCGGLLMPSATAVPGWTPFGLMAEPEVAPAPAPRPPGPPPTVPPPPPPPPPPEAIIGTAAVVTLAAVATFAWYRYG